MPSTTMSAPAARGASQFSKPRFALLVLVGVYPIITALLYVVLPLTDGWTTWQRTLVIAPLMVMLMVWGLIPSIQSHFRGFLNPPAA
jgi:antibiotic biosynthesis monooxygenase (ABM) superfamily enzyme